jgi:hypothetical protein
MKAFRLNIHIRLKQKKEEYTLPLYMEREKNITLFVRDVSRLSRKKDRVNRTVTLFICSNLLCDC